MYYFTIRFFQVCIFIHKLSIFTSIINYFALHFKHNSPADIPSGESSLLRPPDGTNLAWWETVRKPGKSWGTFWLGVLAEASWSGRFGRRLWDRPCSCCGEECRTNWLYYFLRWQSFWRRLIPRSWVVRGLVLHM